MGIQASRLLAITREIVHSRTLAISFFGSLEKLVNLFVSGLCPQSALNLEQKAEEALIPFLYTIKPASQINCGIFGYLLRSRSIATSWKWKLNLRNRDKLVQQIFPSGFNLCLRLYPAGRFEKNVVVCLAS
jgi:hypothetical protein